MYRIAAEAPDHRQEDRREHDDQHGRVDDEAGGQDEQHDQDHHDVEVVRQAENGVRHRQRHLLEHDAVAEDRRHRDEEHHRTDVGEAPLQRLRKGPAPEFPIDQGADHDRVDDRERADLGRREDAEPKPHQKEYREQQRPDAAAQGADDFADGGSCFPLGRIATPFRRQPDRRRERDPEQQGRHETGGEQAADRYLPDRAVDDHADAGRNDRRQQRAERQYARGEAFRHASLQHLAAQHAGLHRGIGDGRARDTAHQRRERDRDLCQPTLEPARQHRSQAEQLLGDAGLVQEVPGENEQRYGQQGEVLGLRDGELKRNGDRQIGVLQEEQRAGYGDRERDRHTHQHQDHEGDGDDQHGQAPHLIRATARSAHRFGPGHEASAAS